VKAVPKLRPILLDVLDRTVPEKDVAVALSGGIDSTVLALALRELGKNVTAYSFTLEDRLSSDFSGARANARALGFPFVPVFLPRDLGALRRDVEELVRVWGLRKKTGIECAWPYRHLIPNVAQDVLVTGAAADGHFGVSKKAMIHHRGTVAALDAYRRSLFGDPDYAQTKTVGKIGESFGKRAVAPYRDRALCDALLGTSWEQVNKPRQKEPLRAAYPEAARLNVMKLHTNLQLGDSGIAEHFERLLAVPDLNPGGRFKSVVGIYNRMARSSP
jgi:asparagine synthetase B (glutamine-hydrolysing)